jgi:hydrogenase/urease accessory protein HupE
MTLELIGIAAAIIFLIGDIPYLRDTVKGVTQPQRVTWGVVTILNLIGTLNQWASGADNSLWLFAAATFATGAIFVASLKHGVGGHSKQDIVAIVISMIGIGLWLVFDSPLLSILATMIVAIISLAPSFVKAKKDPNSETRISWLIGTISALMSAVSVGELNWQLLILPLNGAMLQAYMVYLLYINPGQTSKNKRT